MGARHSPIGKSFNWFVGEDRAFPFAIKDAAGAALPITGFAFEFVVRTSPGATAATLTKTTGAGEITITDGPNGLLEVAILDADTLMLAPGSYHYTLRRTDDGSEQVAAFGEAVLQQADTR